MNPVSFSDDAPGLSFGRRHALRVQADVAPAPDLSWVQGFRSRLLLKPEQELKRQAVIAALPTLPEHERRMFFASIQSFRVHVTDPQPYELEAQDILLGAIPKKTLSVIGQMANQQPGTPETALLCPPFRLDTFRAQNGLRKVGCHGGVSSEGGWSAGLFGGVQAGDGGSDHVG